MGGRGWVISRLSALRGADNWENADQPGQPHPLLSLLLLGDVTMGWREVSRQAPSPRSPPRLPCTRPVTQFLSNDKESELRECVYVKSLQSYSTLCDPWTVAHQVPLGFSRHEYRNGLLYPPPGDLPNPGIEPVSFMSPALAGGFFTTGATWEAPGKVLHKQPGRFSALGLTVFEPFWCTDAGMVADSELCWVGKGGACGAPLPPKALPSGQVHSQLPVSALSLPPARGSLSPLPTVFPDPEGLTRSPSQAGRKLPSSPRPPPKRPLWWGAGVPCLGRA